MKNIIYFLALGLMVSFASCTEELEDANIYYTIAVTPSADISAINFGFSFLRAHQRSSDGSSTALRTIYMESKDCSLSEDQNWQFQIGQSTIEPLHIEALDLHLGCKATITKNGKTRELKFARPDQSSFENLDLDVNAMDQIDITFLLDLAASEIKIVEGEEIMYPVFETIIKKRNDGNK